MLALRKFSKNKDGLAAIETALVLPFVAVFLFGILQISLIFYDISLTSNSLEDASRDILMMNSPSDSEVIAAASSAVHSPRVGEVQLTTTIVSKYGSDYAQLDASYVYSVVIPFYPESIDLSVNKTLSSEIILQR
jgi:Flp pilus assembly protein TadG